LRIRDALAESRFLPHAGRQWTGGRVSRQLRIETRGRAGVHRSQRTMLGCRRAFADTPGLAGSARAPRPLGRPMGRDGPARNMNRSTSVAKNGNLEETALSSEHDRVERIASASLYASGINPDTVRYSFRIFERHLRSGSVLEMGPAEGVMTELLAKSGRQVTVVEGSRAFCQSLAIRLPGVRVVQSLFEDFAPADRFDNIVLGHVLEHVEDPVAILARAAAWLAPGGRILAAVPNSRSLHRQAAVLMNLLP